MRRARVVVLVVTLAAMAPAVAGAQAEPHRVSDTRLLRRLYLSLLERPPVAEDYERLLAVPAAERDAFFAGEVEDLLSSEEFYDHTVRWGHDVLGFGSYDYLTAGGRSCCFGGPLSVQLKLCREGTLHAGAIGLLNNIPRLGDPWSICDDASATVREIEPWWAPGTTARVIGQAGSGVREAGGIDCGQVDGGNLDTTRIAAGCSCGPNLVWCSRRGQTPSDPRGYDGDNWDATSTRRSIFDEPARLFAHLIANDRDLSELIVGERTVANRALFHAYVRSARQNSQNRFLDDIEWWRAYSSDDEWREVRYAEMHPNLLDDRDYTFDPRVDSGQPRGVPSAGVLTSLAVNGYNERERVRGARMLEVFACREFAPPPSEIDFPPYVRDPATEGQCSHCHLLIDPAAIHFKRFFGSGMFVAGVGDWRMQSLSRGSRNRFELAFEHDTRLTPLSESQLAASTDARLLDFLPPDQTLLGQQGDGTIGPLGFARILVRSGEFDRCMARRVFHRFGGRELTPERDRALIDELSAAFAGDGRNVRALIARIVARPEMRLGW
jgi:hypothetical protein